MLTISNLYKSFYISKNEVSVLSNINLMIKNNETVALKGPSGSGKTTLLNLISGIDHVSSGKIIFENYDITSMNESNLSKFRRDYLGIIIIIAYIILMYHNFILFFPIILIPSTFTLAVALLVDSPINSKYEVNIFPNLARSF